MIKTTLASLLIGLVSFSSQANWAVSQAESSISFVSVKKQHIAEAHHFNAFSGMLTKRGQFSLSIALSSVDTGIAIRDERMKEHLFNVSKFASATIVADVSELKLSQLKTGQSVTATVAAKLDISGITKPQLISVLITRISSDAFNVSSIKPLIIKASDYLLIAGVDKLKSLASLPSIGYSVPVSFTLTLRQEM